jgi:hypothetical protein
MGSLSLAITLQLSVVAAPSPVTDEALASFAARENPVSSWASSAIIDDAAMRAEIRRVGFANGCQIMAETRDAIKGRYSTAIVPFMISAVRDIVPADRLDEMPILSFLVGPMLIYQARIRDRLDQDAAPIRTAAVAEMRKSFLERTTALPTTNDLNANHIMPKADIAKALGKTGPYDLDKPADIGLACADLRISPDQRPVIMTQD